MASDQLYGAKCHLCGCVKHQGSEGLEADPIPWLGTVTCERCVFCQERALYNLIDTHGGMDLFDPETRQAVKAFKDGSDHPLLDRLAWECRALNETVEVLGEPWQVADAQHDGQHVHLTLVRGQNTITTEGTGNEPR